MNQIAARIASWPRPEIANGTIEALKWLALVLMIGDHINKYLLNDTVAWLYDAGRLTMPLFVFVLAYNLARPGALESGAYRRTMIRLAVFGALASPAFLALGGLVNGWWPLNILFTLVAVASKALSGFNVARAVAVIHPVQDIEPEWIALCLRDPPNKSFWADCSPVKTQAPADSTSENRTCSEDP